MQLIISIAHLGAELDFENLENALGYVGPEVVRYHIDRIGQKLELELAEGENAREVEEKLTKLLRKLRPIRPGQQVSTILDRSAVPVPCGEDIMQVLLDRKEVVFHAPGVCAIQGRLERMFRALDQRLLDFALSHQAEQVLYPVAIRLDILRRSNFFSQYPHFATFQSLLSPDPENISEAAKKLSGSEDLAFLDHLTVPTTMCKSAACLHAYPSYSGEIFLPDKTVCVGSQTRVFRNEGRNVLGLERLNEFSVRELIFLGSREFVDRGLRACREWCIDYLERFHLRGIIQPANDSFFADNIAALQYFQRSEQTKIELRLTNPFNGNSIAVASVNNHGEHFSKAYDIKFEDGTFIRTGCFGVGCERILFATLAQYGYDESQWPADLREFYFGIRFALMNGIFQRVQHRLGQLETCVRAVARLLRNSARIQEALGRIEARQLAALGAPGLAANEFRVYSQWGEDGILQYLLRQVRVPRSIFVEFGVEDYSEANTRFLLVNDNWSGLVMDGGEANISAIRRNEIYWRYNLKAVSAFITRENINKLLLENGVTGEIGLLSIDIDGNDYWVWESIEVVQPALVVVEYNALFGPERAVTIPYDPIFVRGRAHYSHSYYGASLAALVALGRRKGFDFVGSNSAGNNAFFVRRDLRPETLPALTATQGYVARQFREARDTRGKLTFPTPAEEIALVADLPVVTIEE